MILNNIQNILFHQEIWLIYLTIHCIKVMLCVSVILQVQVQFIQSEIAIIKVLKLIKIAKC